MNPGETIRGLDAANHLWVVISDPTTNDLVAVTNLTTHGRSAICSLGDCVIIEPGEHRYVQRHSCLFYRGAYLTPLQLLNQAVARRIFQQHDPFEPELLQRIQQGAIGSRFTSGVVKAAVTVTLGV